MVSTYWGSNETTLRIVIHVPNQDILKANFSEFVQFEKLWKSTNIVIINVCDFPTILSDLLYQL